MSRFRKFVMVGTLMLVSVIGLNQVALASGTQPQSKTLIIKKSVNTRFDREWSWKITKKASQPSMVLDVGATKSVDYAVILRAQSSDSGWMMSGTIQVLNPTDMDALVTGVSDVADGVVASVVCMKGNSIISFPYTLKAGWSIACSYNAALPNGQMRTNVATVSTDGTVGGARTQKTVSFGAPASETDECVEVTDQFTGTLGTACRKNTAYGYSWEVGPYEECGTYKVGNAAKFVTNDTKSQKVATYVIDVSVPCQDGDQNGDGGKQVDLTDEVIVEQGPDGQEIKEEPKIDEELVKEEEVKVQSTDQNVEEQIPETDPE